MTNWNKAVENYGADRMKGGSITVDGKGYKAKSGPGWEGVRASGCGGAHGGTGSDGVGKVYDSVTEPTDAGSGGYDVGTYVGQNGGGVCVNGGLVDRCTITNNVSGNGNASKEQVAGMLQRILHINPDDMPRFLDATDALGAAYCHYLQMGRPESSAAGPKTWKAYVSGNPDKVSKRKTKAVEN